ncbi:carbohydrate ABC transporter permease [Compostimonas suwonensis]|uniref:Lactose/L-arabinose transport system permease protein n=1 Tax=Compostimonas suwonensis TaxID=1048394 RepID=A0A2M9BV93_9MICO|nr:carbohydrate ABC transporter permease [Compostimonas suwonensis]PJJ61870.1 lactose/L-arabinose transport system permease protein [Compostimonas suwonensis]
MTEAVLRSPSAPRAQRRSAGAVIRSIAIHVGLVLGAAISLFPIYWMFVAGTRQSADIYSAPPALLPGGELAANVTTLFQDTTFATNLLMSIVIAVVYTLLAGLVAAMAGFALAKYSFRGRQAILTVILLTMTIPYQVTLVPLFELMSSLGWINTAQAVILPFTLNAFGVFFMRQSFLAFPTELIEAARLDGAGDFRIFYRIALPSIRPALAVVALLMFMFQWNSFLWPLLVLTDPQLYTAPVFLGTLVGLSQTDFGALLLGTSITTIPTLIFFLVFQKQFVSGILAGALK